MRHMRGSVAFRSASVLPLACAARRPEGVRPIRRYSKHSLSFGLPL
jgi:hypothetical protein